MLCFKSKQENISNIYMAKIYYLFGKVTPFRVFFLRERTEIIEDRTPNVHWGPSSTTVALLPWNNLQLSNLPTPRYLKSYSTISSDLVFFTAESAKLDAEKQSCWKWQDIFLESRWTFQFIWMSFLRTTRSAFCHFQVKIRGEGRRRESSFNHKHYIKLTINK